MPFNKEIISSPLARMFGYLQSDSADLKRTCIYAGKATVVIL